jgi:ACS family hexuronate transporter-like MFS transporter
VNEQRTVLSLRWIAVSVFALSSSLNFLDRQILAALAPQLMREFQLSAADYGDVILAFSICYALAAPLAGLMIDRLGLNLGSSIAVAFWSLAGIATGLVSTLRGLVLCRAALGVGEAGGIPGTGKASALYLLPRERAFGSAISQVGLTLGAMSAPILAEWFARHHGWRSAFVFCGALGFLWIPLWWWMSRKAPRRGEQASGRSSGVGEVLRDSRFYSLLLANVLQMAVYSLWVNWTTVFLVREHGLSQQAANYRLAWIPPVFATLGGLAGGWLTLRWAGNTSDVTPVRLRVILIGAVLLLVNALVPLMPTPGLATALICVSFFACVVASVNTYSLPLDLFGPGRAAFAVSGLTSIYGLLQGVFSSVVGRVVDSQGFAPVCVAVAVMPLGSWLVLRLSLRRQVAA